MVEKIAKSISNLTSPPPIVTLLLLSTPLRISEVTWPPTLVATFFVGILPWACLIWFRNTGKISDLHVTQRHQRWPILLITFFSIIIGTVALWLLHAPSALIGEVLYMLVGLVSVGLVNLVWKLSVHAALITFAALHCFLLIPAGPQIAVAFIAIVGWARIRSSQHTASQVAAGTLLGIVVSLGDFLSL